MFQLSKYQININDYEIIKLINKKEFTSSYLVLNKKTQKQYIAKVISIEKSNKIDRIINNEIKNMTQIVNPTIINLSGYSDIDFTGSENNVFLMEYNDQGSLLNIFENNYEGCYNETAKQIILIGIAYGMMKLHQNFEIHSDLNPENILLDKQLHPQISGFGISKIINCIQSDISNKTIYKAPEILNNEIYNGKCDVYSFGIIMLAVITNSNPISLFESIQNVSIESKIHEISALIKEPFKELILKCLSLEPYDRPLFQEIFNKLSFDDRYRLENVSNDQLFSYIEYITQNDEEYSQTTQKIIRDQNEQIKKLNLIIQKLTKTDKNTEEEDKIENNECNDYTIPPPPPPPPPKQLRPYYLEPTTEEMKEEMLKKLAELEQILMREERYWFYDKQYCSNYDKPRLDYLDDYINLQKKLRLYHPDLTDILRNRVRNLISSLNYESCKNQRGLSQVNYLARGVGTFVSNSTVDTVIERLKSYL